MLKDMEWLRNAATDEELLEMHEMSGKDFDLFQKENDLQFSKTSVRNVLFERGYSDKMHKLTDVISKDEEDLTISKRPVSTKRVKMTVPEDSWDEYQEKIKNIEDKSVVNDFMLQLVLAKLNKAKRIHIDIDLE